MVNKKLIIVLLIIASIISIAGCVEKTGYTNKTEDTNINKVVNNVGTTSTPSEKEGIKEKEVVKEKEGAKHWTYEGEEGPTHWAELGYSDCNKNEQSPVNIPSKVPIHNSGITFNYKVSTLNITNNGHTVQVTYGNDSTIDVGGKKYKLLQFHLHSPSEHKLNNSSYDIELHLVHQSDDGKLAVIGVMLENGTENSAYSQIWKYLPKEKSDSRVIDTVDINAINLLPSNKSYYRYNGSLTTPPCSEGVSWFVMTNPVKLSKEQIDTFETIYSDNNRPIQELNKREFS
jgi:carbonic anhydrase